MNTRYCGRNYRVATAAIESFVDLVERCLRVLIPGALVYARPRMGKTHAIDYVCLHLERSRPDVLTVRMSCEHHRTDFEGPFFSALLIAAGATGQVLNTSITNKRQELIRRLRERLAARRGHIVVLFCDEAQRQSRNAYEWLRDVHDQLAYHGIRLITFLVGQPQLLAQKAGFQMSGDEQIVARFMIEQLQFYGIADAAEAATCLAGYDRTRYPEHSGASFTGFFLPQGVAAGLRLEDCGADLWNAFVRALPRRNFPGRRKSRWIILPVLWRVCWGRAVGLTHRCSNSMKSTGRARSRNPATSPHSDRSSRRSADRHHDAPHSHHSGPCDQIG
jgi:hypothetical protein